MPIKTMGPAADSHQTVSICTERIVEPLRRVCYDTVSVSLTSQPAVLQTFVPMTRWIVVLATSNVKCLLIII